MRCLTWIMTVGLLASAVGVGCDPAKPAAPIPALPSQLTPMMAPAPPLPPPPMPNAGRFMPR